MTEWSPFRKFFNRDTEYDRAEEDYALSMGEIREFAGTSYFTKFCEWLDKEAAKPLPMGSHPDLMIQSAMRANTLREVRAHLDGLVARARAATATGEE